MDELKQALGETLYRTVREKLGGRDLLIDDGKLIPKHRFDCINLSLREHKALAASLREENARLRAAAAESERFRALAETAREETEIYDLLLSYRARCVKSVRPLLNTEGLHGAPLLCSLEKQIRKLRKTHGYLFADRTAYRLVPVEPSARSSQHEQS